MSHASKEFPKTLEGFGYGFNEGNLEYETFRIIFIFNLFSFSEGKLRKIDKETGKVGTEPFNFQISSSHAENQRHYEALGDVRIPVSIRIGIKQGVYRS